MARLNEPPVSADTNFEILRRKFLRQNRDIAKINSDQSQKIRRLENDCALLLSENLDLRGQIIRLEKQLEDNSARRMADHALEIKAKLEEQLAEFGALLGNLGMEPPSKRHSSSEGRRFSRPRRSSARSPPARKRRDTNIDPETLAAQEGRLPPIYENKSYPRATMNSEEILALCAAAADTSSDSLELGPPPVSRFIEEIPVKQDSPIRRIAEDEHLTITRPPKLDYERKIPPSPEPVKKPDSMPVVKELEVRSDKEATPGTQQAPTPTSQPVRAGAKRKYGDENNVAKAAMALEKSIEKATSPEKIFPNREVQKRRSIKELPNNRKRQPLAAKSTNEDVCSPKKAPAPNTKKACKPTEPKDLPMKDVSSSPPPVKPLPKIELPPPPAATIPEAAEILLSPTTPSRAFEEPSQPIPHDTPPPAHISSEGETSRPSRRARSAVSYAEPNLRDKMRRPTKELFDAVSGLQRHSLSVASLPHPPPSAPSSVSKPAPQPTPTSPQQKEQQPELISTNIVFDRRRSKQSLPPPLPPPPSEPAIDVYDFPANPESSTTTKQSIVVSSSSAPSRPSRKSSMAAQAALHKILDDEKNNEADTEPTITKSKGGVKNGGVKKSSRSSMLVSKRTSMMEYLVDSASAAASSSSNGDLSNSSGVGDDSLSSVEEEGRGNKNGGNSKVGRRRSMMI
ncbi:hypothetical protein QBC38DRAFT_414551 [Podospora fimiseda]|uniref:Shugoshin n=1 Tax=Podospora fimiseda TaxID=252190 RepID=A0AAN7H0E9_9PEZI|nr:hypothetical protein QBC38DRAFT_414551 [Podospora fimiseda]